MISRCFFSLIRVDLSDGFADVTRFVATVDESFDYLIVFRDLFPVHFGLRTGRDSFTF